MRVESVGKSVAWFEFISKYLMLSVNFSYRAMPRCFSHVRLFATLWTVAYQAPLWNDWCETISWCGFHLHFPDNQWCWAPFHVPIDHLYIFSGKMSVWFLFPFSIKLLFLIKERVMGVLYMFWLLSFYLQYDLQIFSPIP